MVVASAAETAVPGRTCESTGTSLPEAGGLPSRMAAPPARFTSRPFSTLRPLPLRHTTILPRTLSADREFGRHWLHHRPLNHVSTYTYLFIVSKTGLVQLITHLETLAGVPGTTASAA